MSILSDTQVEQFNRDGFLYLDDVIPAGTLLICEYTAEDCYPLQSNHIPSKYMYEVVRGHATNRVRCSSYDMTFPEVPTGASFFEQQAKAD